MKISISFLLLITFLITGCAHSINQVNADRYFISGEKAVSEGDLLHAKKMYIRALVNARSGGMDLDVQSQIYMKLGRVHGSLCEYKEAEKCFQNILEIYKNSNKKNSKYIFIATMELGQFNYDIGRYKKAVTYFEQALAINGKKFKETASTAYYEVLVDLHDAYIRTNSRQKAKEINKEIKANAKYLKVKSGYVRYPKVCK